MTSSGISNEAKFVLVAANRAADDPTLCAAATRGLDWSTVLEIAVSEGVQTILARRLRACEGLPLPAGVSAALDHITRIAELRMQYVRRRLHEVLEVLASAGIPVVLLKGAALANWAYASFGDRYMSDIDLLVRPEDAGKAHSALQSTGWRPRFKEQYNDFYRDMHHLMPLVDGQAPAMKLNAEIHTSLIAEDRNPFLLTNVDFWRDAERLDHLPGDTRVLSPLHALWHACVHYAWSHMFTRGIRTFQDVDVIARSGRLDWSMFVSEAERSRAATCCYWTLVLSRKFGAADFSEDVLFALEPPMSALVRRTVSRHLENEIISGHGVCPSIRLRRLMWQAAIRPARSGHGTNRPWTDADWKALLADHPEAADALPPDGMPSSRNFAAWLRYMQALLVHHEVRDERTAA